MVNFCDLVIQPNPASSGEVVVNVKGKTHFKSQYRAASPTGFDPKSSPSKPYSKSFLLDRFAINFKSS
jgi:hypothetical protein